MTAEQKTDGVLGLVVFVGWIVGVPGGVCASSHTIGSGYGSGYGYGSEAA
jgi:hypothetical protein